MLRRILVSLMLATFALCADCPAVDVTADWTLNSDNNIEWYKTAPAGLTIVGDKTSLRALNPSDGSIAWEKTGLKKPKASCLEPMPGSKLAIWTVEKDNAPGAPFVSMIDITTGAEYWNTKAIGLGESYGHFFIPTMNALLFYGKQSEKPKKKFVALVDILSGDLIWQKEEMFEKWDPHLFEPGGRKTMVGNQPPLFDSDSTMILFLNDKSLRKYNFRNGNLIWESDGKLKPKGNKMWEEDFEKQPCAGPGLGYTGMLLSDDGQTIYSPYQNTVGAFRMSDGAQLWKKAERVAGVTVEMHVTDAGLLTVATDGKKYEIKMHNFDDGKEIWKAPVKKGSMFKKAFTSDWEHISNIIVEDGTALVAANSDLWRIHLGTGEPEGVADLAFQGSDGATSIELQGDEYIISGSQNISFVSIDGKLNKHVYFRPPDNIGGGLMSIGLALAFDALGSHSLGNNTTLSFSGDIGPGLEELLVDFNSTAESVNCLYILAEPLEGDFEGVALLRVSKDDGAVTHRIPLNTREPDYEINWYQGNLILKNDKKSLSSYQF